MPTWVVFMLSLGVGVLLGVTWVSVVRLLLAVARYFEVKRDVLQDMRRTRR